MAHKFLINATDAPIEHPISGQLIQPGQTYSVPDDAELKAQEKGVKAYEKWAAKAAEDAAAKAKADEEEAARAQAEEEARLEEEKRRHAELLAKQQEDVSDGSEGVGDSNDGNKSDNVVDANDGNQTLNDDSQNAGGAQ